MSLPWLHGGVLLESMVNSLLLHSMGISPLSMGVSLGCWVLMGSMVDSPLLHSMGISPLSIGVSLVCWGSLGLFVHWLPGSVLLGLDLFGCAGLVHCESFSPSMANFLSETKLKTSFSAMSQCAVLALTQSSKVLKEIDLLLVSSMVLKEFALLTSCSLSWKETFFLPHLPMVLKEVFCLCYWPCLQFCWHHPSLMALMTSTLGVLKGVNLCLFAHSCPVCWLGS